MLMLFSYHSKTIYDFNTIVTFYCHFTLVNQQQCLKFLLNVRLIIENFGLPKLVPQPVRHGESEYFTPSCFQDCLVIYPLSSLGLIYNYIYMYIYDKYNYINFK